MTHTQVNFSVSPRLEIGVSLLELGVGLVSWVSLVSHMVKVRAMLCGVNCVCNVCGSAHSCGCMVNSSFAVVFIITRDPGMSFIITSAHISERYYSFSLFKLGKR